MTQLAFVFPGQGSQSVGMMTDWGDLQSIVDQTFEQASDSIGFNLKSVVYEGPEERLNQTDITQPAMLTSGVAAFRAWQSMNMPEAKIYAGHSLGEYTALVCANSLKFEDAINLVHKRGQLMQSAVADGEGAMAAIIGLADDDVIRACEVETDGVVSAVNFNSPGQVVIAGNKASVELAMARAKDLGAKRALPLPVSVPSHCDLMRDAADALFEELSSVDIQMPEVTVLHNQNASSAVSVDDIRELLKLQLYQPVQWVACVQNMKQAGVEKLVEFGPGKVLTGLTRRIDKSLSAHAVLDSSSLQSFEQ